MCSFMGIIIFQERFPDEKGKKVSTSCIMSHIYSEINAIKFKLSKTEKITTKLKFWDGYAMVNSADTNQLSVLFGAV